MNESISIIWHINDVKQQAESEDIALTDEQASNILIEIQDDHDATIGINWDVISYHIGDYIRRVQNDV